MSDNIKEGDALWLRAPLGIRRHGDGLALGEQVLALVTRIEPEHDLVEVLTNDRDMHDHGEGRILSLRALRSCLIEVIDPARYAPQQG